MEVAGRLNTCAGETDLVARMGDGEFAVLCIVERDLGAFAAFILDAVSRPFELEGQSIDVRGSGGIAVASDSQTSADPLIKNADIALYAAMSEQGGRVPLLRAAGDQGGCAA